MHELNLVVHIPHRMTEEDSGALSLAQRAPAFMIERAGGDRVCIATFPDLPKGIDLALQLIGESVRVPGAWASVNARPISNLTKLWQRLECYRESLLAPDPVQHCEEKAALFQTLVGCEARSCPVPCQFLCTPCIQMLPDGDGSMRGQQIEAVADSGEIGWCPQLKRAVPPAGHPQPVLLHPHVHKS